MDSTNQHLLALLQANARASTSSLARELNLSRSTVQDRIRKLEQQGLITGYTVQLNPEYKRHLIATHVMISVSPKFSDQVVKKLKQMHAVKALHAVSGQYDLIAILYADTTVDIDKNLDEIGRLTGIERTTSSIVLSTKFER